MSSHLGNDSTLPERLRKIKGKMPPKESGYPGGLCPICKYPILMHNYKELTAHREKAR
jgi:hypothetical protein